MCGGWDGGGYGCGGMSVGERVGMYVRVFFLLECVCDGGRLYLFLGGIQLGLSLDFAKQ